jgi:hypothetical protein
MRIGSVSHSLLMLIAGGTAFPDTGCAIWSPLQWEIPSLMARRRSGRGVHKTESWVTRAARRRSRASSHST